MKAKQLELESIVNDCFKSKARHIKAYIKANKAMYHDFALKITPDLDDPWQIWDRIAFAILSANSGFSQSVRALAYATQCKGNAEPEVLVKFGMVPRKAEYLNKLPLGSAIFDLLKTDETWNQYRLRLQRSVLGLGLAKASFAACLLYPLEADLGCVDTHICKIYLRVSTFKQLNLKAYRTVEANIRVIAKRAQINTFLAQWLIWDHERKMISNHDIFPGAHKLAA